MPGSLIANRQLTTKIYSRLVYSNNKKAGTAKVIVASKGNYSGSVTKTFVIKPASIAKAKLALSKKQLSYTGKVQTPSVKTVGGKKPKAGRDYAVKYSNAKSKNVGKYSVKVVGKGTYAGTSASATYRIVKAANPLKVTFQSADLGNRGFLLYQGVAQGVRRGGQGDLPEGFRRFADQNCKER